ncbi:MAG TPA: AmmeMemoRadiSam system protein A [Pyrinomonadaceae bacterium]|nr:AmmeMemoRadiSam system protein A [Pyrinomonadaceae bacterium]
MSNVAQTKHYPSEAAPPALARAAVEAFVRERRLIEPDDSGLPEYLMRPAACFVSIKTVERDLRGCIGTTRPEQKTLAEEIIRNAVRAATRDPRFNPISEDELPALRYSVDVLESPEPCRPEELDPEIYGVIVEDSEGSRRGLLLPNIEGVETAARQVEIAARKAGIPPQQPLKLFRFRTRRFKEAAAAQD